MAIIKATHIVRPVEAAPTEIMYINSCDQIKDIVHTPTIYFYNHSSTLESVDPISILKDSLSKALSLFYPLAGRLNWSAEGGSRVELHCNGKGVPIIEAESNLAIEDFRPTPLIQPLIPSVDYTTPIDQIPLVIVQVTRFRCGGLSLGLGISHVMADGPSALHFINEWTKFARGVGPVDPPFLDRRVVETEKTIRSDYDPSVLRRPPTLIGDEDSLELQKKPIEAASLTLSKIQIEKLRQKANLDLDLDNNVRKYSRFEVVAAHIWRCASKARSHVAEQQTRLYSVADFRNKLEPPLPNNYFGNALIRVEATDNSGSLLTNPLGAVSRKIRKAVEKVSDGTVRGYLDYLKKLPDVGRFRVLDNSGQTNDYFGNPNLAIISWIGLPLYGADFGWGNEIHLGPGPMGFDGKIYIIPDSKGYGLFNIVIWLHEENMDAFKKYFYDDI